MCINDIKKTINQRLIIEDESHNIRKYLKLEINYTKGKDIENLGILGVKGRFFTEIKNILKSGILDKSINYKQIKNKLSIHREYLINKKKF